MVYDDFQKQIHRLKSVYGDRAFPDEKVEAIWQKIGKLPAERFAASVSHMIVEDFKPTLTSILNGIPSNEFSAKAAEEINWDCSHCGQSGSVCAVNKKTGYQKVFLCSCIFGNRMKGKFTVWTENHEIEYTPEFYKFDASPVSAPFKIMHRKSTDTTRSAEIQDIINKLSKKFSIPGTEQPKMGSNDSFAIPF